MKPQKRWPIILLIWAGGLFLFLFFVLEPLGDELNLLNAQREELEREIIVLRRRVQEIDELELRLSALHDTARLLEGRLPDEREIPDLLITIEDAAFLSGVGIQSFVPRPIEEHETYSEVPFSASLRTTYHSMLLFLNNLRRADRLIQSKRFTFQPEQEGGFRVDLDLSTYILTGGGTP